ncbi:MAG: hypothetical protein AAB631_02465 [Patescibacteria group bacterium]
MGNLLKKGGIFLKTLRRSNEATKKKWVYVVSGISSVLILFLWVAYLNLTLPVLPPPPGDASPVSTPSLPSSNSFFSVLGRGFKNIGEEMKAGFKTIGSTFSSTFKTFTQKIGTNHTYSVTSTPPSSSAPIFIDMTTSSPTSTNP